MNACVSSVWRRVQLEASLQRDRILTPTAKAGWISAREDAHERLVERSLVGGEREPPGIPLPGCADRRREPPLEVAGVPASNHIRFVVQPDL